MTENNTRAMEFDDWELARISQTIAAESLVYLGHYEGAGLKRHEVDTMNRLFRLSDKLSGDTPREDLPYKGTRGNGWRADRD